MKPTLIPNTFSRNERLKRSQHIDTLFRQGKAFSVSPLRVQYRFLPAAPGAVPVQAAFSAPKKAFKHASDRNLLKRRMRESWRLRKQGLPVAEGFQLHLMILFASRTAAGFAEIDAAMAQVIASLSKKAGASPAP